MSIKLGVISIIIGVVVLSAIIYFNIRFDEIQSQSEIIDYYVYGRLNKVVLYGLDLFGLVAGITVFAKSRNKLGLIGACVCLLNFIKLTSQSY